MAGSLRPVLKGVYVCDDVVGNPVGGKPMIVNLWNAVRVPAGAAMPYTLKKVCVFAWLRGGRGRVTFRIEVVEMATGLRLGQSRFFGYEFTDPNATLYGRFMLEDVTFPSPGSYTVEFFCDGEFLDDQPIRIIAHGG
jgi:hypothetical protein